jgi:hypothetical protein
MSKLGDIETETIDGKTYHWQLMRIDDPEAEKIRLQAELAAIGDSKELDKMADMVKEGWKSRMEQQRLFLEAKLAELNK